MEQRLDGHIKDVDVAVIGGGPAGISACLELSKTPGIRTALFESEAELGGMPRSCHLFFGLRDMKRLYSGPGYARKLTRQVNRTGVDIHTNATAVEIVTGQNGAKHQVKVVTKDGLMNCKCRYLLLATGCFELSREGRRIPGTRPAGIFTTGSLQQLVNLKKIRPGNKALIIGSEHVSLSAALTLNRAGMKITGLVSEDRLLHTYPYAARALSIALNFPIFSGVAVGSIYGKKRVEGVQLKHKDNHQLLEVDCDTIVCTGKFHPDAALIYKTPIKEDSDSMGPIVDTNYMTRSKNIYAAGNVLHGADMHDVCAMEGRRAAESILKNWMGIYTESEKCVAVSAEKPLRYVVPQTLLIDDIRNRKTSYWHPGVSVQANHTLKKVALEAWSGSEKLYSCKYSCLIADSRVLLPVEKFRWEKVDFSKPVIIKAVESQSGKARFRLRSACYDPTSR